MGHPFNASKRLNVLSALKYKLDRRSLEIMYQSFIRPIVEYGNSVWSNCSDYQSDMLEKIQKRAARIITGGIVRTPTEILYNELGWQSLKERREQQSLTFLHKIVHGDSPAYLFQSLEPQIMHGAKTLRNNRPLREFQCRTQNFHDSFIPKTTRQFNKLNSETRNLDSKSFKKCLNTTISTPKWFSFGDRKLSMIQSRFRMNCSSLKADLFNLNIIESSNCVCSSAEETAEHYFMDCPLYNDLRVNLQEQLANLNIEWNINNLLCGDPSKSILTNKLATSFIQSYISSTDRFG